MHATHRRDAGLRKVSVFTRRFVVSAVALTAGLTALVARGQPAKAKSSSTTPPTSPATASPAAPSGNQTRGTLPPDTFAPAPNNGNATQGPQGTSPSTAPTQAQAPQPPSLPPDTTPLPPAVVSGSS
jgi:hypothetical protein